MPKQEFDFLDYFGPLAVAAVFLVIILFLSFIIINFYFITPKDDLTVFELVSFACKLTLLKKRGYLVT